MKTFSDRCRPLPLLLTLAFAAPQMAFAMGRALPKRPCATNLNVPDKPIKPTAISRADLSKSKFLEKSDVKDQGRYGCCWISSDLGGWEKVAEQVYGKKIKLDENYMILSSLFYRVEEAIYYGNKIYQGGWAETADWMGTHIGLAPEEACHWNLDLRDPDVGNEIVDHLNVEVGNFQAELAELVKNKGTEKEIWDLGQAKKKELLGYLRKRVGNFPSSFKLDGILVDGVRKDGVKFTPNSFANSFKNPDESWIRIKLEPTEPRFDPPNAVEAEFISEKGSVLGQSPESWKRLPNATKFFPDGKKPTAQELLVFQLFGKSHIEEYGVKETSLTNIHAAIEESIDADQPVFLGTFMVKEFYKNDSGMLSIGAFGKTVEEARKAQNGGGHAVLITGIYKDADGKLLGYQIQNSWGKKVGDLGYYAMDLDYFDTFMMDVVFHGKLKVKKTIPNIVELKRIPGRASGAVKSGANSQSR